MCFAFGALAMRLACTHSIASRSHAASAPEPSAMPEAGHLSPWGARLPCASRFRHPLCPVGRSLGG